LDPYASLAVNDCLNIATLQLRGLGKGARDSSTGECAANKRPSFHRGTPAAPRPKCQTGSHVRLSDILFESVQVAKPKTAAANGSATGAFQCSRVVSPSKARS